MPITQENVVNDYTKVSTGDMSDIAADISAAPDGKPAKYRGTFIAVPSKSKNTGEPQLIVTVEVTEALTEGCDDQVGRSTRIYINFPPAGSASAKWAKLRVKEWTDGFNLPPCDPSGFEEGGGDGWATLSPWVDALEEETHEFWVTNPANKETGLKDTRVHALEPGGGNSAASSSGAELDEKPAPAKKAAKPVDTKPAKKASKK